MNAQELGYIAGLLQTAQLAQSLEFAELVEILRDAATNHAKRHLGETLVKPVNIIPFATEVVDED